MTALGLKDGGWLERKPNTLGVHLDASKIFEPNTLILTEEAKRYIIETSQVFAKNPTANLRIEVWQDNGSSLLEQESALELALLRAEVLTRALVSQKVSENDIQIGAYEGSAGVREERFLRQKELVSFVMTFEENVLKEQ